ncbi:reverse transcriptase domain-containing protein [Streptomyces sp. NPDC048521]|uniref:reverse transcriptase domain-containing protein n=1 Tax=Streptomyces sp. NPDC048521 TaxID=3365566 RepID=UPI00371A2DEE
MRGRGTPRGSAVSPVLANLFMHHAQDAWLTRTYPGIQFERFADDAVVHCASEREAREVLCALDGRMEEVGLRLHPNRHRLAPRSDSPWSRHGKWARATEDERSHVRGCSGPPGASAASARAGAARRVPAGAARASGTGQSTRRGDPAP